MDGDIPLGPSHRDINIQAKDPKTHTPTTSQHEAVNSEAAHIEGAVHHDSKSSPVHYPKTGEPLHIPTTQTHQMEKKEKGAYSFLMHALQFIRETFGMHDKNKLTDVHDKISKMPPAIQNLGLEAFIVCLTLKNISVFKEPLTPEEEEKVAEIVKDYANGNLGKLKSLIPSDTLLKSSTHKEKEDEVSDKEKKALSLEEEQSHTRVMAAAFKEILGHLNLFETEDGDNLLVKVSDEYDPESLLNKLRPEIEDLETKEVTKLSSKLPTEKAAVLNTILIIFEKITYDENSEKTGPEQKAEVLDTTFTPDNKAGDHNVNRLLAELLEHRKIVNDIKIAIPRMSEEEYNRRNDKIYNKIENLKINLEAYKDPHFEKNVNELVFKFANAIDLEEYLNKNSFSLEVYLAALEKIESYRNPNQATSP